MENPKDILENFCKIENVKTALLINRNGDILEKFSKGGKEEIDSLELVNFCISKSLELTSILTKGNLNQSFLEFKDFNITLEILTDKILVIIAGSIVNLGRIRFEIRKSRKDLEGI